METMLWDELNANAFTGLSILIELIAWTIGLLSLGGLVACVIGMIWEGLNDLRHHAAARVTTSAITGIGSSQGT